MCKFYLYLRNWLNESLLYLRILIENWKENWEMRFLKFVVVEKSVEVFFGINDW